MFLQRFLVVCLILVTFVSCGSQGSVSSKATNISVALEFPEGFEVERESGSVISPSDPIMAAAPSYVKKVTVTIIRRDDPAFVPIIHDVPLDTGIVEGSVPAGDYLFSVVVETNIELTFAGTSKVTLVPGPNRAISVKLDVNAPPIVSPINASKRVPRPKEMITVSVIATDPDDDPLTFTWKSSGGGILGSGASVKWGAVKTGKYNISVEVSDGEGGVATRTIKMIVALGSPTNLVAIPGENVNWLKWKPVNGATRYHVYWTTATLPAPQAAWTRISNILNFVYVHKPLVNGVAYHYRVSAVDGVNESLPLELASATPNTAPVTLGFPFGSRTRVAIITGARIDVNGSGFCAAFRVGTPAPISPIVAALGAKITMTASTPTPCVMTGLTPATAYNVYFVARIAPNGPFQATPTPSAANPITTLP